MGIRSKSTMIGRNRWIVAFCVGIVALLLVPLVASNYGEDLVLQALVFAILAISWNLLAGYAGQISLGHAAFFGIGAYVSAWLTTPSAAGLPEWLLVPAVLAILVGGVAAAVLALLTGPAMFRLRGHYFAIGTLALAAIIQLLLNNERSLSGGATGFYVHNELGEVGVYYLAVLALIVIFLVTYYLKRGRLGLGVQAVRDDEDAASTLGVNPLRYKMWAFLLSSFFAGIAGGLYGQYTLYLNASSTLGVAWTIDTLVIVILGGMGTVYGPLFGTAVFMLIDKLFSQVAGGLATTLEGVLIILFVIFLPQGLYGYVHEQFVDDVGTEAEPVTDTDPDSRVGSEVNN
ncbi:branched-chain amino acid ABC transporter permease [Haladaptatus sp. AB618]|uniref:branched-chain amino acid ABC transporter permease n=1 Tax=Haladaptatus sp. AB618 TaxID=2934173 RepID=UPI00209C44E9|nr:branched-chain amino acid ABC transporter permease [Haladaptatus sp. AB618]MCO8255067.1 branched-chain amino acid ABC transporter permease [Haladaptatus sp. AB618]